MEYLIKTETILDISIRYSVRHLSSYFGTGELSVGDV